MRLSEPQVRRFIAKIVPTDRGCVVWVGALNSKGYGCLTVDKRRWLAHRLVYTCAVGEIPTGMQIDHICVNRRCVWPLHLQAVTGRDNRDLAALRADEAMAREEALARVQHFAASEGER